MADLGTTLPTTVAVQPGRLGEALPRAAQAPLLLTWPGARLSPFWPAFTQAAGDAAARDARIVGAILSVPRVRPGTSVPFVMIEDGGDVFFTQHVAPAAVWFTCETAAQLADDGVDGDDTLAAWLTHHGRYLIAPRTPLAHGHAVAGMQRMLLLGPREWRIPALDAALALYDSRLEIAPEAAARLCPALMGEEFSVDLWGTRGDLGDGLLLSSRLCRAPRLSFPLELVPCEANLTLAGGGAFFSLGNACDFEAMSPARTETLFRHATRYNAMDDYIGQFLGPLNRLRRRR